MIEIAEPGHDRMVQDDVLLRVTGLRLSPGTTSGNVIAYIFVSLSCLSMAAFFPLMQPFVLSEDLGVPRDHVGRIAGTLALVQNIAVMLATAPFGAIVDRVGRRQLMAGACLLMGVTAFLYPLATSVAVLAVLMFMLGMAQTGTLVGGATVTMDYPDNRSRGRLVSLLLILQITATALLIGQFGVRLPALFKGLGYTGRLPIRYAFWCVALLAIPAGLAALRGLRREGARIGADSVGQEVRALLFNLGQVVAHARRNILFRLILMTALSMRADFAVMTTFLSLWVSTAAHGLGIAPSEAIARAGSLYSFVLGGNLAATIAAGLLIDRVERVTLLTGALGTIALAMLTPLIVSNPFVPVAYLVALALGVAEGAIMVPCIALLGQEAPAHLRGSSAGIFSLVGVIGVSLINLAGGILLDRFGGTAPFLLMVVINAALFARMFLFLASRRRRSRA